MKKLIIFSAFLVFSLYAENKKWEYCRLSVMHVADGRSIWINNNPEKKSIDIGKTEDLLLIFDRLGRKGWEIISINLENTIKEYWMKRSIK